MSRSLPGPAAGPVGGQESADQPGGTQPERRRNKHASCLRRGHVALSHCPGLYSELSEAIWQGWRQSAAAECSQPCMVPSVHVPPSGTALGQATGHPAAAEHCCMGPILKVGSLYGAQGGAASWGTWPQPTVHECYCHCCQWCHPTPPLNRCPATPPTGLHQLRGNMASGASQLTSSGQPQGGTGEGWPWYKGWGLNRAL